MVEKKQYNEKSRTAPGERGLQPLRIPSCLSVGLSPHVPWPPSVLTGRCTRTSPCMCCAPERGCSGSCRAQSHHICQKREPSVRGPEAQGDPGLDPQSPAHRLSSRIRREMTLGEGSTTSCSTMMSQRARICRTAGRSAPLSTSAPGGG